ncbi:MAG: phosphoribosylanthranilate isomerase [Acidobacteriota bacterium]|nr:phosphoribosylanthranilate isomerase [Acidobacteriota bacterium]
MVFVKICGITNLEDARAAVDAGADAVGFNFYRRSPRFIAPVDARDIIEQLPETVLSVGVFVNEGEPEQVARIADLAGLKAVQLHGDESPQYCRALRDRFVIKALRVGMGFEPQSVKEYETNAILLDAFARDARGGTGRVIDWSIARQVRELVPQLFLAGGLSVENVAEAITIVEPYAVDACSSLEQEPGRKDADRVRAFVAAAHVKP